jgi:hypothetical protein
MKEQRTLIVICGGIFALLAVFGTMFLMGEIQKNRAISAASRELQIQSFIEQFDCDRALAESLYGGNRGIRLNIEPEMIVITGALAAVLFGTYILVWYNQQIRDWWRRTLSAMSAKQS